MILIDSFMFLQQPHQIIEMIETHLPARGLRVNSIILSHALHALAKISLSSAQAASPEAKAIAREYVIRNLRQIEGTQDAADDRIMANRIKILSVLGRGKEVLDLYKKALRGQLCLGPRGQASIIKHFGYNDKMERALEVLGQHFRLATFAPPNSQTYTEFMGLLVGRCRSLEPSMKYSIFVKAMKVKPKDVHLLPHALGLVLALALAVGKNVNGHLNLVLQELRTDRFRDSFRAWSFTLETMLNHKNRSYRVTRKAILVGLILLSEISGRSGIKGLTPNRAKALWGTVFRHIAMATTIRDEERRQYIDRAIELFPKQYEPMDIRTYFGIVESCLARRHVEGRTENGGINEAMYRWKKLHQLYAPVRPAIWTLMLQALGRSKRLDKAQDLVADAWNQMARLPSHFWETAEALNLTESAGIRKGEWRAIATGPLGNTIMDDYSTHYSDDMAGDIDPDLGIDGIDGIDSIDGIDEDDQGEEDGISSQFG